MEYFFDTYAIIEIMHSNPSYERYKDYIIITSVLNIGEIYAVILREKGKIEADEWFNNFSFKLIEITPQSMIESVYFRMINRKKNISLPDAVGYILSLKYKLKFLTGDSQFINLPNVEFVK